MTTQDIYQKIQKLLKLASNNPSKEEAAAAMAKAQALMTEHRIEQVSLQDEAEEEILTFFEEAEGMSPASWKRELAHIFAAANGCYTYRANSRGKSSLGVMGKPSNIRALSYLFQYCVNQIEEIAKREATGLGRSYIHAFKFGCVTAIGSAIKAEQAELEQRLRAEAAASNDSRALMVVNNSIAVVKQERAVAEAKCRARVKLKAGGYTGIIGNADGFYHGQKAGRNIYPGKASGKIGSGSQKKIG